MNELNIEAGLKIRCFNGFKDVDRGYVFEVLRVSRVIIEIKRIGLKRQFTQPKIFFFSKLTISKNFRGMNFEIISDN